MSELKLPVIKEPGFFPFPDYQSLTLDNGIVVNVLPFNNMDFTNIQITVKTGSQMQSKLLQSAMTNRMLREGCEGYDSEQLAEVLDYYGTTSRTASSTRYSDIIVSSVSHHLPTMIPLLHNIVFKPTFPEKEFKLRTEVSKQKLIHSLNEVSFLSSRQLRAMMFGDSNAYATAAKPDDYDRLAVDDLRCFHQQFYKPDNILFFVSGKFTSHEFHLLNEAFGKVAVTGKSLSIPEEQHPVTCTDIRRVVEKRDCVQNSISMGAVSISQQHPDFLKLKLLICVLGGYFGSRLMSNIREEKGYTYGIYAQLVAYDKFSTILISSQTATEYTDLLIDEVYKELGRLITQPIPKEELDMVKNYFTGMYLQQVSKQLDLIAEYRVKVLSGIDIKDYCKQWWNVLHNTTSEELLIIAKKYLKIEDFRVSIAGKYK